MKYSKSSFRAVIGNSPTARIIEYLIECEGLDFSLTDIAEGAGVGWTTLHRIWLGLESAKLVKFTCKIGNAKLYTLNTESQIAKALIGLFNEAISLKEVAQVAEN